MQRRLSAGKGPREAAGTTDIETSESRPITVSWILPGQLGLCFCPGKRHTRGRVRLERSLEVDLCRLKERYKIQCIVALLNDAELRTYSLRSYGQSLAAHGLDYVQYPIIECAAPEDQDAAVALIEDLALRLGRGQTLAVHCRGGVGRAGMIAACLLLRLGHASSAENAISEVRRLRCKTAVETRKQEDFVAYYHRYLGSAQSVPTGQATDLQDGQASFDVAQESVPGIPTAAGNGRTETPKG